MKYTFCGKENATKLHTPLRKWYSQADYQIWETYVDHMTGNLTRQREVDGKTCYTSYKAHPMKHHIAYTKGRGKEVHRPDTMYQISMHSESPKSWVFNQPGNSNIRPGTANSPQFLINQDEAATCPQIQKLQPQGTVTPKKELTNTATHPRSNAREQEQTTPSSDTKKRMGR